MARRYRRSRKRRRISKRKYRRVKRGYRKSRRGYKSGKSLRRMKFGAVRGFGGYKVKSNSILSGGMSPPMIMNTWTNDGVVMRHREFCGNLVIPAGYNGKFRILKTIHLNPGVELPWLRGIAENWKEYEWHGVLIEYKPLTALATTTGAGQMGSVMIGTHYDMYEAPFANKLIMLNSEYTTSGKPQLAQIHPIECKRSQTVVSRKWVRTEDVPPTADKRLYDHCFTEIAIEGVPPASSSGETVIGEIWVTFEVCLYKPKLVDKVLFMVEQDLESFKGLHQDYVAASTKMFTGMGNVLFDQQLLHIARWSSMTGAFYPSAKTGSSTNALYEFNSEAVGDGDVFRLGIYFYCESGITMTNSDVAASDALVFPNNNVEYYEFLDENADLELVDDEGDGTGFDRLAAPAFNVASRYRWIEFFVRVLDHRNASVQFNMTFTPSAETDVQWQFIIHKLKNTTFVNPET